MKFRLGERVLALRQGDVPATVVDLRQNNALPYTIEYFDAAELCRRHVAEGHLAATGAPIGDFEPETRTDESAGPETGSDLVSADEQPGT